MKTKTSLIANRLALATFFLHLLITSPLLAQIPAYVPTNGLVGYWPFNGNANDESGNGNHGIPYGNINFVQDRFSNNQNSIFIPGGGPFNNEQGNYIKIDNWNYCTENSSRSYVVWTKVLPNQTGTTILSAGLNDNYACNQLWSFNASNTGDCAVQGISVVTNCSQKKYYQNFADGDWHMWTLTYNGANGFSGVQYYFDGELLNTIAGSCTQGEMYSSFQSLAGEMYFGMANLSNAGSFEGCLDDIAIYNRALTQEEITALYNGTTAISGCTNITACNYNASATQDDGSCTYPAQTYLNCAGTCINDADNDGTCDELETPTLPSYIPSNGLVGYWPFNGNANDESGNGNHGTVNGATLTTDRNGNANSAYSFDGIDDYIFVASNFYNIGQSHSVNLWISVNDIFSSGQYLWNTSPHIGEAFVYNWNTNLHNVTYCLGNGIEGWAITCGDQMVLLTSQEDIWKMFTMTYSSGEWNFYINGAIISTYTNSNLPNGIYSLFFGDICNPQGPHESLDGILDDIAIYNRALTQEEITALYTGTTNGGGGGNGGAAGTPAQIVPQGIPYQAMIRDNNGAALINTPVTVRFSLRQDAIDGTVEYQETHNLNTNTFGLINTHFGTGTATQGTFAGINWSNTTKFIQVEANTGAGYVDMGTQQMMSVPFALKANESNKVKNAGLPVYANNAAALAGGLVAGDMYRTAAGILMIVY